MPKPSLSELTISQIALPVEARQHDRESDAAPFRSGFCRALLDRLANLGVEPIDLQMRDLPMWTSGRQPLCGSMQWMRREDLKDDHLIEVMGQMNDPNACLYNVRLTDEIGNRGMRQALDLIDRAKSLDELVGAWAIAAMVPLVISARARVKGVSLRRHPSWLAELPDYLAEPYARGRENYYSKYEALEIAENLTGLDFPARQLWNSFSTFALPNMSILLPRDTQNLAYGVDGEPGILDYIAGSIASTLVTHRPVRIDWHDHAPIDAIRLPVEAASARIISQRAEARLEWQRRQEAIKTETPLQRRHRMLPDHSRYRVEPGARDFATATDAELRELDNSLFSIEAIAVWYGVTSAKMSARLRAISEADKLASEPAPVAKAEARTTASTKAPRAGDPEAFVSLSHVEVLAIARSIPRVQLLSAYGLTPAQASRRIEAAIAWEKAQKPAR